MQSWVDKELQACKMADTRLVGRLNRILNSLGNDPERSIPAASQSWADIQGTYRFLSNDRVSFDDILSGHREAMKQRIGAEPVVLIPQDTTFFNFARHQKDKGMGTLKLRESDKQLLHLSVALTPQRVNLGIVDATLWKRPEASSTATRTQRRQQPTHTKESQRWLDHYQSACTLQQACPDTTVVSIADREGDIHDWFVLAQQTPLDQQAAFIIRAKSDRRVEIDDDEYTTLWPAMSAQKAIGRYSLDIPARGNQAARTAQLKVYTQSVAVVGRSTHVRESADLQVVYVKEHKPPQGVKRLEWMLLTNLEVEGFEQARTVIEWYRARWEIEVFFKVLKSGCQVEYLRLETPARLLNCLAVYLIVAWHLHNLTMLSRHSPGLSCDRVLSELEWKTILLMKDKKKPPKRPPPVYEVTRKLAMLGGFIGRKGDGEPGIQSIWRGYQKLMKYIEAIQVVNSLGADSCV